MSARLRALNDHVVSAFLSVLASGRSRSVASSARVALAVLRRELHGHWQVRVGVERLTPAAAVPGADLKLSACPFVR